MMAQDNIPLLEHDDVSRSASSKTTAGFALSRISQNPEFTSAEMWLSYELNTEGELREKPLLMRPFDGKCELTPKDVDPLCYVTVKSRNGEQDLMIILATHGVSVYRLSDSSVLGFFPATGERVII